MFFLCINVLDHYNLKILRKDKCSLPAKVWGHTINRERISSSVSHRGSITVEAACILPVFIWGVVFVLYFIKLCSVLVCMQSAIQETGKDMAVFAYVYEKGIDQADISAGGITDLAAAGLSAVYAKSRIVDKVNKEGTDASIFVGGVDSVSLLRSGFLKEDEMIDIVAEGKIRLPVPFFSLGDFRTIIRGRVRAWTGRDGNRGSQESGKAEDMVYVTVNGEVYHKDAGCSHISLSIQSVYKSELEQLRNDGGGKYHACEKCGSKAGTQVYITDSGDRYHSSLDCAGLKRSVLLVPSSQVEGWHACSRCGSR